MKYSFMSFSCPEADVDELISIAAKYGYDGVEPRTASGHRHGIELESDKNRRKELKEKFASAGIEISCVATSCRYADPAASDEQVHLTKQYIELASDVGAPVIRVFGGRLPAGMDRGAGVAQVSGCLQEVSAAAEKFGVAVCFETHDDWCDPAHVAEVIDRVNHPFIRINWDIMHPVKRVGKTIDESFEILRQWISHVHFHDGVTTESCESKLVPIGDGVVDHKRAVELLQGASYEGFLSGEWIDWEPCDVHLPRELDTMRAYERG